MIEALKKIVNKNDQSIKNIDDLMDSNQDLIYKDRYEFVSILIINF